VSGQDIRMEESTCRHWSIVPEAEALDAIPHILGISESEAALDKLIADSASLTYEDIFALGRLNSATHTFGFSPAVFLGLHCPPELVPEFVSAYQLTKAAYGGGKISATVHGGPKSRYQPVK